MSNRDVVVVGASSGGIDALKALAAALPADLASTLLIVLHSHSDSPRILDAILSRAGRLPARLAKEGERLAPGTLVIAPPGRHLTVTAGGRARLGEGPTENGFRPSIDALFRSAALAFGSRAVGVVLSGQLDDGTAGLAAIKSRGGVAIVQDPREALAPSMAESAIREVAVDHVATCAGIARLIDALSRTQADAPAAPVPALLDAEVRIAQGADAIETGFLDQSHPSVFSCPACHGVLMEIRERARVRFRCHTGHAYTDTGLLDELRRQNETTMWNAVRSLEETTMLLRRMATVLDGSQQRDEATRFRARADEAQARVDALRARLAG